MKPTKSPAFDVALAASALSDVDQSATLTTSLGIDPAFVETSHFTRSITSRPLKA